jgi:hypothetical protein
MAASTRPTTRHGRAQISKWSRARINGWLVAAYQEYLLDSKITHLPPERLQAVETQFRAGFLDAFVFAPKRDTGDLERHAYDAGYEAGDQAR